jgi:hypothetical protein
VPNTDTKPPEPLPKPAPRKGGRQPIGEKAMTSAERKRRQRAKQRRKVDD